MIAIVVEVITGTHIEKAVSEAISLASKLDVNVRFEFWGVPVLVAPNSNIVEVVDRYRMNFNMLHLDTKKPSVDTKG